MTKARGTSTSSRKKQEPREKDNRVFTMQVDLYDGRLSERFNEKNPVVSRTIQILAEQTLDDLHWAIFNAHGRYDEHLYEFRIGGRGPGDRKAPAYLPSMACDYDELDVAGDTESTTIGSLALRKRQILWYWFDFGDDWRHQIRVVGVDKEAEPGQYPRVIERTGDDPPQYINWDEEEEDEDEDDAD